MSIVGTPLARRTTCLIVHHLLTPVILLQQREKLHDIRVLRHSSDQRWTRCGERVRSAHVSVELIARPVEAEDEGPCGMRRGDDGRRGGVFEVQIPVGPVDPATDEALRAQPLWAVA